VAARFLWRKHPVAAILFYTALFLTVAAPVVALYGLVWLPVTEGVLTAAMTIVFGLVLTGCIVAGCALFWNATGDWVYAAYFTLYFAIIAAFEFPYALVSRR
jgi:hyaluronan synthase